MTQIRVDEVSPTKSGKAWSVKSGNQWYVAFKDSGIDQHRGRTIEAEIEPFGKGGQGIKSYKLIDLGPATPLPNPSQITSPPFWLAFASNCVAHCIDKGLIKEQTDIKAWVFACKNAAEAAADNDVGV